jgi:hypothetical protein
MVPTAACETMNVRPATTIDPVRAGPGFASALKLTVPSPDPLGPAVTRSQASFDVALHVQASLVFTSKLPEPAPAPKAADGGLRTNVHAPPSWATVKVWPAMVTVPDRGRLEGVSSTTNATVPGPAPAWPAVMRTQGIDEAAVQVHPVLVLTATAPGPPK